MRYPTMNIDYTSRDYLAFKELLIQKLQEKMPEYTDTSETDAGIVILEALANGLDIMSLYADIVANDVILPTTQSRRLATLIARCLGYTPYNQTGSVYKQVFVLSEALQNDYVIPAGTTVRSQDDTGLVTQYYETVEDLVIPAGDLGDEKDENDEYIHTALLVSGETIYQDVIGSSNGSPLQSFKLSYTNVLVDSIEVYVNEGNGDEVWTKVDTFFDCDENSKVYMIMVDEFDVCTIQFGNGLHGKIPTTFANGISANYAIGGGEASNVSAGVINTLESGIPYVASTFNLAPLVLAHDKESLDSIKYNASAAYRAKDRLVTFQDYEDLLRIRFFDFLDIKAMKDANDIMLVHLFYKMKDGYTFSADLASAVATYIGERSMVGTSYDIQAYSAQTVNISATLYYDKNYNADLLKYQINEYLESVTFNPETLLFGDTVVKSDVEAEIKSAVEGVYSFRINTPSADIITPTAGNYILELGTVTITAIQL